MALIDDLREALTYPERAIALLPDVLAALGNGGLTHNYTATTDPTDANDSGEGYTPGSAWVNNSTNTVFFCADGGTGSGSGAVWREVGAASGGGSGDFLADGTVPMTDDLDMGTNALVNVGNVDGVDVSGLSTTVTDHIADTTNPHAVTVSQLGALAADGSVALTGDLDMGAQAITNVGDVDGVDVSALGTTVSGHIADTANPHSVTAVQVGADASGTAASAVSTHESTYDHTNLPSDDEKAALAGTGTPSVGNPYVVDDDSRLSASTSHIADTANPHSVTAVQVGADVAGTAATAVSTHESTYSHANLPTADQKAALAGTGTPAAGDPYVNDSDSRLTDNRTDATAIHDDVAGEINALTTVTAVSGDFVVIEDASDSFNKKKANVSDFIGSGTDADAIHDNVAGEINALATKATPTTSDMLLIEDAADSFNKKKTPWPSLGGGGGTEFADDTFRIQDNADATKEIAFEAGGITTGTTRTITMPDANVDLGSDFATAAQGALADSAQQPPSEGAFVDGDKTKLDGIEAGADVTATSAVGAASTSHIANTANPHTVTAAQIGVEAGADVTDTANVTAAMPLVDETVLVHKTGDATAGVRVDVDAVATATTRVLTMPNSDVNLGTDFATAAQGALADSAQQPPSEGAFVDGDKTKLDGIEALADVTDTVNVTAAGAVMDSEVTNLSAVKSFDPADYDAAGTASGAVSTHESTYSHANLPTTDEKAALVGTGTPSGANVFVTNDDSRLTDGRTDAAAIHDDVAGEINALTTVTAIAGDMVIIEDASDSFNKKKANVSDFIGAGTDADAIHDNVAGEINALTTKSTPTTSDMVLIEDAADSFNKKKAAWPASGGGGGGVVHSFSPDELQDPYAVGPIIGIETITVSSGSSIDVPIPTHADGDLLLAIVAGCGDGTGAATTFGTPSGWTQQTAFTADAGGSRPGVEIFTKTAASEGADETWTIDGSFAVSLAAVMISLRHCTYDTEGTPNTATAATIDSPTVTLADPGYAFFLEVNDANTSAPERPFEFPDDTTGIAVLSAFGAAGSNGLGLGVAYKLLRAEASGTRSWVLPSTEGAGGHTIAISQTSDWAVTEIALPNDDLDNQSLRGRRFDDTTEQAVSTKALRIPDGATNLTIRYHSKPVIVPGGSVNVIPKLYTREFADNTTPEAWDAGTALTALAFTTNLNLQDDEQVITLSSLSLAAGSLVQFQLSRDAGNGSDTLTGDWFLANLEIEFS